MEISNLDLFKCLVSLSGMNNAQVADMVGINRPNLYTWLSGKSQVMSKEREEKLLSVLGVYKGKLSGNIVHRWRVGENLENIRTALTLLETKENLDTAEIYFVKTDASATGKIELFNLMVIPRREDEVTILVTLEKPLSTEYPIKKTKLTLGKDCQIIDIWADLWYRWWNKEELTSEEFWSEASHIIETKKDTPEKIVDIDLIASYENQISINKAEDAGLRAIIRGLLNELRKVAPKSKLLDQSERAKIYQEYYDHEINKTNI